MLFLTLQTQWVMGPAGPTGLNYPPLFALLDRRYTDSADWEEAFADIQVLELAALQQMRAKT